MAFADRELTCRDCSSPFVFTSGEQEFYASKGLQNDPVRCPSCRTQRKMMRPEDRDDAPSYGVYASWGGRTPRQLHVATCSGCQRAAEVPFIARGDRPVFCSDCYNEERRRQEAVETAESEAMAARSVSTGGSSAPEVELEGSGRSEDAATVAVADEPASDEAEQPAEEEEARPVVADTEAAADSTPAPITE